MFASDSFLYRHRHTCWVALVLSLSRSRLTDIFTPFSISLFPSTSTQPPYLSLPHLILMHGCMFGLCRDSLAPGGFSWNQFTLPVPSHWSTIYRPSTAGAAGRLFNRYIRCLTWQSIYSPSFKHNIYQEYLLYCVCTIAYYLHLFYLTSSQSLACVLSWRFSLHHKYAAANVVCLSLVLVFHIFWDLTDQPRVLVESQNCVCLENTIERQKS